MTRSQWNVGLGINLYTMEYILNTSISRKIFSVLILWLLISVVLGNAFISLEQLQTTVSHANKDVGSTQTTHSHNYFCRNQPGNLIKKRLQNLKTPFWNGADLCIYPRFDILPHKPIHQSIFIKPWANKAQSSDDCVIQECVMVLQVHCTEPSFSIVLSAKINIGDEY